MILVGRFSRSKSPHLLKRLKRWRAGRQFVRSAQNAAALIAGTERELRERRLNERVTVSS